uniref:Uncharacterized protein n=1 Tax=Ditylenchus dipsaci TaxID=166011 RepID=A0A915DRD2_9BILA
MSTDGSVVECSPATRATRVRFSQAQNVPEIAASACFPTPPFVAPASGPKARSWLPSLVNCFSTPPLTPCSTTSKRSYMEVARRAKQQHCLDENKHGLDSEQEQACSSGSNKIPKQTKNVNTDQLETAKLAETGDSNSSEDVEINVLTGWPAIAPGQLNGLFGPSSLLLAALSCSTNPAAGLLHNPFFNVSTPAPLLGGNSSSGGSGESYSSAFSAYNTPHPLLRLLPILIQVVWEHKEEAKPTLQLYSPLLLWAGSNEGIRRKLLLQEAVRRH